MTTSPTAPADPNAARYADYAARLIEWRAADPYTRGPVPTWHDTPASTSDPLAGRAS